MTDKAPSRRARAAGGAKSGAKFGWAIVSGALARAGRNNIGIASAGVAFYIFLSIVPLLAATVLTYGLVSDAQSVARDIGKLSSVMPPSAAELFAEQLRNVVATSKGKQGFGLVLALGLALLGARNGAGSILTALNIAHGVPEGRTFIRANAMALLITVCGVVGVIVALVAIAALAALLALLPTGLAIAGSGVTYTATTLGGIAGAAALYRYAPNRELPRWKLVLPGAIFAALGWLLLTLGFGVYVSQFGNYNATYGSLSAVVVLLTWLYFSAYALLFGAELNAAWGDRRPGYEGLAVG